MKLNCSSLSREASGKLCSLIWNWLVTGLNHLGAELHFDLQSYSEACQKDQKGIQCSTFMADMSVYVIAFGSY